MLLMRVAYVWEIFFDIVVLWQQNVIGKKAN